MVVSFARAIEWDFCVSKEAFFVVLLLSNGICKMTCWKIKGDPVKPFNSPATGLEQSDTKVRFLPHCVSVCFVQWVSLIYF